MIDRYSERDISALWDEYSRLKIMLDVELAVCQAWCEQGRCAFHCRARAGNRAEDTA